MHPRKKRGSGFFDEDDTATASDRYRPQVWRIENLELAEVKPSMYGQFYGGDCYLVLYTYLKAGQKHYILYTWQVRGVCVWGGFSQRNDFF